MMEQINNPIAGEINALRQLLSNSDYKVLKYIDGELSEDEYQIIKAKRQEWRQKINELEAQME